MKTKKLINYKNLLFLIFTTPLFCVAQVEAIFNDIHFNESVEIVQKKMNEIANFSRKEVINNTCFPLASKIEEHLIYTNIKTNAGLIKNVAFTFADDKLVYIEASGNAYRTLIESRTDKSMMYLGLDVFFSDFVFGDKEKDKVRLLTKEGTHLHLFLWSNPYFENNSNKTNSYNNSVSISNFLKMGEQFDSIKTVLEKEYTLMEVKQLDGADPSSQIQIDAFGIEYAGFPRKIEARFGDNKLNAVWILTAKVEEDRIREKLTKEYGEPSYVDEGWEVFGDWRVYLKKDINEPEVLYISKELAKSYKKQFIDN